MGISEEVGIAKPHLGIFEYALAKMGHPRCEHVLMVGDNPDSDIVGGIQAGFDTCWLNVDNKNYTLPVLPTYQVSSLLELKSILLDRAIKLCA